MPDSSRPSEPDDPRFDDLLRAWSERREGDPSLDPEEFAAGAPSSLREPLLRLLRRAEQRHEDEQGPSLRPGQRIGDFRLIRELGRGGMGRVWEAEQASLRRRVAFKVLRPRYSFSPTFLQRFQREAEAGGRLQHPGIVATYAVGATGDLHWIAQELVPGGYTLADSLAEMRARPGLPEGWYQGVAALFLRIARALQHAHQEGVIHRDLKPGNILLDEADRPKVADFGLALLGDDPSLSRTGDFVGTPFYVSPEQALGGRMGLDARTDIFSLGATFYETLTLRRPFEGDTSQEVFQKILTAEPVDPRRVRARVPRDLAVICLKCLEKNPDRRYADMHALAEDLRRFLAQESILARPPSVLERAWRWCRRHPTPSVAAALLLTGLPILSGLGIWILEHRGDVASLRRLEREARAEQLVEEGWFRLFEGGDPASSLEEFRSALTAMEPGDRRDLRADALAGLAWSRTRLEGLEAGLAELARFPAGSGSSPARDRAEAILRQAGGDEQGARRTLAGLGPPASALEWSLEGRRWLARGEALGEGRGEEALARSRDAFHRALLLRPEPRLGDALGLARALGWMRRPGPLLEIGAELLQTRWPEQPLALFYRAFALGGLQPERRDADPVRLQEAVRAWRDALYLDPGRSAAHQNLGNLLVLLGRFDEAEAEFREAVRLESANAAARMGLGNLLSQRGRAEDAENELRAAVALAPGDAVARLNLGVHLERNGRAREAEACFRQAVELAPEHPTVRHALGTMLQRDGRLDEAEAEFRTALENDPGYGPAWNNLGHVLHARGRLPEAEKAFREAMRLQPRAAGPAVNLAVLRQIQGDPKEAEALYREALRRDPGEARAHGNLGNLLAEQGRLEEAGKELQAAEELAPGDADYPFHRALVLLQDGRPEEAAAALRRALEVDPARPLVRCQLGLVLLDLGRPKEAVEELRRGHEEGTALPGWSYPSADWLQAAEEAAARAREEAPQGGG